MSSDFSNNLNFLGPPEGFAKFCLEVQASFSTYPDDKHHSTRTVLANLLKVAKSSIAIEPCFWEYEYFYRRTHGDAQPLFRLTLLEPDFKLDYNELERSLSSTGVDLCYLANPNNPTATELDNPKILEIICKHPDVLFIVDETYINFSQSDLKSLVPYITTATNICVVSSLSKIYSLPGLRIGIAVSNSELISTMYERYLLPYGVSPISLSAIPWLLKQTDYIGRTQEMYTQRRDYMTKKIGKLFSHNIQIVESSSAFVLLKINSFSKNMAKELNKMGLTVRSGSEFPKLGNNWIRVSIKDYEHIDKLVDGLKNVLSVRN
ncbi:putative threonine-phosphate decarboxylase isoform X2 [Folsomia candida]|uniref:histidinol-phosphate transaminase n=1 Tax=Folsomia candida TaxID=158441 RepID=A0A226DB32_FOLCA|nr:putative threonine-phosphate decarboxylase isoform X2 [Folsomia candida]OXA42742.1 Histidinol-phosphate aminotransferase [Folsomia candida]